MAPTSAFQPNGKYMAVFFFVFRTVSMLFVFSWFGATLPSVSCRGVSCLMAQVELCFKSPRLSCLPSLSFPIKSYGLTFLLPAYRWACMYRVGDGKG